MLTETLVALEEVRSALRLSLERELDEAAEEHYPTLNRYQVDFREHLKGATGLDNWPPLYYDSGPRQYFLMSIIKSLQSVDEDGWQTPGCGCGDCFHKMSIRAIVDRFEIAFNGLCLACVREDTIPISAILQSCSGDPYVLAEKACLVEEHRS